MLNVKLVYPNNFNLGHSPLPPKGHPKGYHSRSLALLSCTLFLFEHSSPPTTLSTLDNNPSPIQGTNLLLLLTLI